MNYYEYISFIHWLIISHHLTSLFLIVLTQTLLQVTPHKAYRV